MIWPKNKTRPVPGTSPLPVNNMNTVRRQQLNFFKRLKDSIIPNSSEIAKRYLFGIILLVENVENQINKLLLHIQNIVIYKSVIE